jgi:adenylate kinase family enzyme
MKRILITVNAGSGKTKLATAMATHTGLAYVGLDKVVWQPHWKKTPGTERIKQQLSIANEAAWVVDGVSALLLEAADTVVFLDFPRHRCFWHAFCRNLPYLFRSRPGLPERCPEILIIPTLIKIIWLFPKLVRPGILEICQSGNKRIFHIRSNGDLLNFKMSIQLQEGRSLG